MKKINIVLITFTIFLFSCKEKNNEASKSTASEAKVESMDSAAMMKNWMDNMTPGAPHELIAKSVGEWTSVNTMWMDPDAPPTITEGSCVNKMILGGRYLLSENKGNFNGMPFEGIATTGYDNIKKVFFNTWIDNFGTGMMTSEGTYDSTSKTITFTGKMIDPMTSKEMPFRETFSMPDDNTQIMEMFGPRPDGKGEYKSMNIVYTRKK